MFLTWSNIKIFILFFILYICDKATLQITGIDKYVKKKGCDLLCNRPTISFS